jgi:cysteinyl-tRNA synthetase
MGKKVIVYSLALIFVVSLMSMKPSCGTPVSQVNYRAEMTQLLEEIKGYAQKRHGGFVVIGNNSLGLLTAADGSGKVVERPADILDGFMLESYYFGWELKDDERTPAEARQWLEVPVNFLLARQQPVLNIDYCRERANVDWSYKVNRQRGLVSFAAASRDLADIPAYPVAIPRENGRDVRQLRQAQNFLVLLNPREFASRGQLLASLRSTNYDLIIIDLYYHGQPYTAEEIQSLKRKKNGGQRLVIAYMSVGEAEDYRPYWQPQWTQTLPAFIEQGNPDWPGSYKVKYWSSEWKDMLFGSRDAYLDKILAAKFDGVFLDVVDAYYYFEEKAAGKAN